MKFLTVAIFWGSLFYAAPALCDSCWIYVPNQCQNGAPINSWFYDNWNGSSGNQIECMQRAADYQWWCGTTTAMSSYWTDGGVQSWTYVVNGRPAAFSLPAGAAIPLTNLYDNPYGALVMQTDGNLVAYQNGSAIWGANQMTDNAIPQGAFYGRNCNGFTCRATLQWDGNLVLYNPGGTSNPYGAYWTSNTWGNGGAQLALNLSTPVAQIISAQGSTLWASSYTPGQVLLTYPGNSPSLGHQSGYASASTSWSTDVNHTMNSYISYGPYTTQLLPGNYQAVYSLQVDNNTADNATIATIDVNDAAHGRLLASKDLKRTDFSAANAPVAFSLPFTAPSGAMLEFRILYHCCTYLQHYSTSVLTPGPYNQVLVDATPYDQTYTQQMNRLWQGSASFQPMVAMKIATQPDSTVNGGVPYFNGMNMGTQILPHNGVWYLFNREYNYTAQPPQCRADFSRIVVRSSTNQGQSWSAPIVLAEPNLATGECALTDGHAFLDTSTGTWHYLVQALDINGNWNTNHYSYTGQSPLARFSGDGANPVIRSGALWNQICGPGKACPQGTGQEGTMEISYKAQGYFYVTFHGVYGTSKGFRGMAKTTDFHNWITNSSDLPNDAIWSSNDCQNWNVAWNPATGCIGGGHGSSLVTSTYTYLIMEAADTSMNCSAGQNWVAGLVRGPSFEASGHWQQLPGNALLNPKNGVACSIQYQRLFADAGNIYLSYWLAGPYGPGDENTTFYIMKLKEN